MNDSILKYPVSQNFMVIVNCMTYNQSRYIIDALNGFAIQETAFPYVCVVVDDASTDGEQDVLQTYIENECNSAEGSKNENDIYQLTYVPHKLNKNCIFAFYFLKRNLYKEQEKKNSLLKCWRDHSKYEAMCEGDDYWTDPLKLQKQVDFLESHPDYSICFTNCISKYQDRECVSNKMIWDTYNTKQMILHNGLGAKKRGDCIVPAGHTSTLLYRFPQEPLPKWTRKCFIGDEPLFIALSVYGKAKFINECSSVYRKNVGVSSKDFSFEKDWNNRIQMYRTINRGLDYKYNYTIRSIIAHYYFKLAKLSKHSKDYSKMLNQLIKAATNNPLILFYRWLY